MHFVVSPVLHAYVYGPSGPQMSTFSPGHTCVSGAEIEQLIVVHVSVADAPFSMRSGRPSLRRMQGSEYSPTTWAVFVTTPRQSCDDCTRKLTVRVSPAG